MTKIAVNPKLFITCRLCLEELGNYQIVPSVKEQIEYCFGIQVEPFDGLPQLICDKCEEILTKYTEVKKGFINKQNELKAQIAHDKSLLAPNNESQAISNNTESNKINGSKDTKREQSKSSSSSGSELSNKSYKNIQQKKSRNTYKEITWPTSYKKQFVCRICDSPWSNIITLRNHINNRHRELYKKYGNIFKRHCQVSLIKTDKTPNFTLSKSKVVHERRKIIKNVNSDYHILYTTKDYKINSNTPPPAGAKPASRKMCKNQHYYSSDSSADEIIMKRKRKRRLYSNSSNETVKLESKSHGSEPHAPEPRAPEPHAPEPHASEPHAGDESNEAPDSACINIDDTTGTDSDDGSNPKSKQEKDPEYKGDYRTINEIIDICRNKYIKKHYQDTHHGKNASDIASNLQHKIFSIGRKTLTTRKGVNAIPLLRFLEHKNLDIAWLPRASICRQESTNIRIMPRPKNISEKYEDTELGWVNFIPPKPIKTVIKTVKKKVKVVNPERVSNSNDNSLSKTCNKPPESIVTQTVIKSTKLLTNSEPSNSNRNQNKNSCNVSNGVSASDSPSGGSEVAVLTNDVNLTCSETKKLLNANPVANPKQLPKKFISLDLKPKNSSTRPAESVSQEDNEPDLCMPIITSTTSLAKFVIKSDDPRNPTVLKNSEKKSEVPRIKVKPVSELMSAETLNRLQNPTPTPIGKGLPLNVQNVTVPIVVTSQNLSQSSKDGTSLVASPQLNWQNEDMIFDSVDLPNTKTNAPYMYFKKLLQLHHITLLDSDVTLNDEFHCLIKFKVLYKQEETSLPVILCLALFCSNNIFCLSVKDRNNEPLDITKMSPNWQWEVLKIYKAEVVDKLLNNAQKISQSVYENTNSFLCLLKSINMTRPS